MKTLHLTDEEIQEYATNSSAVDKTTRKHVDICEECKARVEGYQLLFKFIKQQPQPAFDFDLAALVMAKLPTPKPAAAGNSFIYFFVVVSIALTGAAVYYFRTFIASLFTNITPLLFYLTATSITTLAVILSVDMYKNYHRKMKALDFY